MGKLVRNVKRIAGACILMLAAVCNVAALDKQISIQGKLTESTGGPKTGVHDLYFSLYASSGGNPVWGPERYNVDLGNDGLFNVTLASTSLDSITFNQQYYVGIKVDGEEEMVPRQKLSASPYALGSVGDFSVGKNLDVNEKVGIGTSNPSNKLHVGAGSGQGMNIGLPYDSMNTNVPMYAETGRYNINFHTWRDIVPDQIGAQISVIRTNNYLPNNALIQAAHIAFLTSSGLWTSDLSEKMRITSNGNVGIGTTTPGYTLTVNGSAWCQNGVWSGSDIRYKENIESLPSDTLNRISDLKPIKYNWKTELRTLKKRKCEEMKKETGKSLDNYNEEIAIYDAKQIGISAQELEKVFPELVHTDKNGYKAVAYERLSVVLLEAINEQQKKIESLETRLKAVEQK